MKKNRLRKIMANISEEDRKRRKREGIIILCIIFIVIFLTFIETRVISFGEKFPISNTILMFIVININLLLLILMIFLVFRNIIKLVYDRSDQKTKTSIRTKLIIAFIALTLLPTVILFLFSMHFITTSIEFWFNAPVDQALNNSLAIGRLFYNKLEEDNKLNIEKIAFNIKSKSLLSPDKIKNLVRYIQLCQKEFKYNAVEVYNIHLNRIAVAVDLNIDETEIEEIKYQDFKKDINTNNVKTFSKKTKNGEIIKTIGTVPYGVNSSQSEGYVAIDFFISSNLSEGLESISKGIEEYQQMKMLKKPIKLTYYITLSIVALLVLFCAVWFGFYLAKSITIPIMELADGTRKVAEGDLSVTINMSSNDEIGSLVDSFNKMTRDLKLSREQLEYSATILREQNIEIEERRQYMEIVLKNISAGVISLDANGVITTFNKASEKMLNFKANNVIGNSYKKLVEGKNLDFAKEIYDKILNSSYKDTIELPLRISIDGNPRSFLMHINALMDDKVQFMGMVLVFDDLTELEKAQRMAAWREVARRVAHEVKNPLTPIKLSAQRLKRKYSVQINDSIFDECTNTIVDHVDLIKNLVNEFSTYARFPTSNPIMCELPSIIEEIISIYREGHENIKFEVNIINQIPALNLDRHQIKRAVINLVDNAIAAVKEKGIISILLEYDQLSKTVKIEVADNGVSISEQDKARLFEPYFSTKKTGMGLGLTIVSTIVSDHNGKIRVQDNHPQGVKFIIELPAAA